MIKDQWPSIRRGRRYSGVNLRGLLILAFLLSGCDVQSNADPAQPPEKPSSVPDEAIWVGGADGGVFVKLSETARNDLYTGSIYRGHSGEVWYQGRFEYTGDEAFDPDKPSNYESWDGTVLHLNNQESLAAIE